MIIIVDRHGQIQIGVLAIGHASSMYAFKHSEGPQRVAYYPR
jgi:hypothetical protein